MFRMTFPMTSNNVTDIIGHSHVQLSLLGEKKKTRLDRAVEIEPKGKNFKRKV